MTTVIIRSISGSFGPTTASEASVGTLSVAEPATVHAVEVQHANQSTPLAEYVQRQEAIPSRKAALDAARQWAAENTAKYEKNNLRSLREEKNLSQARLALSVGTTQAHIARIESGRFDTQVSTLVRVAAALGVPATTAFEAFVANLPAEQ
jgi:DNA-binding XRE family transcriptional regulator